MKGCFKNCHKNNPPELYDNLLFALEQASIDKTISVIYLLRTPNNDPHFIIPKEIDKGFEETKNFTLRYEAPNKFNI